MNLAKQIFEQFVKMVQSHSNDALWLESAALAVGRNVETIQSWNVDRTPPIRSEVVFKIDRFVNGNKIKLSQSPSVEEALRYGLVKGNLLCSDVSDILGFSKETALWPIVYQDTKLRGMAWFKLEWLLHNTRNQLGHRLRSIERLGRMDASIVRIFEASCTGKAEISVIAEQLNVKQDYLYDYFNGRVLKPSEKLREGLRAVCGVYADSSSEDLVGRSKGSTYPLSDRFIFESLEDLFSSVRPEVVEVQLLNVATFFSILMGGYLQYLGDKPAEAAEYLEQLRQQSPGVWHRISAFATVMADPEVNYPQFRANNSR